MFKYIFMVTIPVLAFAAGDGEAKTDIFPRVINFLIFAAIAYYLLANRLKLFFTNRKNSIADRLDAIQKKLRESEQEKEKAKEKVEEAKVNAKAFLASSEKENELLLAKIAADLDNEMNNLEKSQNDQMDIERRKMTRAVINEVLDELFKSEAASIDRKKFIDIVLKKVA
ncbi:MAG: F0F1 ATP synthase subunit B [Campylobacteraceae bacterium]